jgi:hypothetical protein
MQTTENYAQKCRIFFCVNYQFVFITNHNAYIGNFLLNQRPVGYDQNTVLHYLHSVYVINLA